MPAILLTSWDSNDIQIQSNKWLQYKHLSAWQLESCILQIIYFKTKYLKLSFGADKVRVPALV